jgi:putative transposase
MIEELDVEVSDSVDVPFLKKPRTPAWLIQLACRLHAGSASLAECADVLEWFGIDRTRQAVNNWYGSYTEYCDQEFTATPDRVAVDEKQIQIAEEENVWLYAAIDVDEKVILHAHLSPRRGTKPATRFLRELKTRHNVEDAEFLVDGMGYLTALARTDLDGDLNYSDRNIVEKLFQTVSMRIGRFHETWNASQASAERWLTGFVHYYNHLRSHQALDNQPPVQVL